MKANPQEIAWEVKKYLQSNGITMSEAARKMGCTQQAVSNQLSGRPMGENVARRWASAFGMNPLYLMAGEGMLIDLMEEGAKAETLLVIPTGARAGTLGDFEESVSEYECERIVSPVRGADYAMLITGDSMSPEYPSGAQIIIKKVNEQAFIEWGKVYVLDTDNGAIVKQVRKTSDPEVVECVSLNPAYQPFEVPVKYIRGWYRVLMVLSLK